MSNIYKKIKINFERIAFEGSSLTILLFFILIIIISNNIRVIKNGQDNYNIYKIEQESLNNLTEEHKSLEKQLEIVSSDEYQKLLAREVLGIAEPSEELYKLNEDRRFYEFEAAYIDLSKKGDFMDWWFLLVK